MTEQYDKELEQLEKQQRELRERKLSQDRDRYSSENYVNVDPHDYMKIINAKINISPKTGETLEKYIIKLEAYQQTSAKKNWDTHVDNPYKVWRTHKLPLGCFMCEDQQFIDCLLQVLQVINHYHKDINF